MLDNTLLGINEIKDKRGFSINFKNLPLKQFHIVSINPGAIRGDHVHEHDEFICVIGGKGLAVMTLEDPRNSDKFTIDDEYRVIRIPAGVKHIIKNIGDKAFYIVCFSL